MLPKKYKLYKCFAKLNIDGVASPLQLTYLSKCVCLCSLTPTLTALMMYLVCLSLQSQALARGQKHCKIVNGAIVESFAKYLCFL